MKSKLVADTIFDDIWESWPNKEKEHAARKAFDVFWKSGEDLDQLQKACRIYVLDSTGDEFHYQLNNFINQDYWRDILESGTSLERLEKERKDCIDLIKAWNAACLSHWLKAEDIEDKIPSAKKALQNKYFRENWRKALDKIIKIFQYKFRDEDHRSKIILSFRWFTRCQSEKHTVLRAMEGEFGYPSKSERKFERNYKEISPEQREKAVADFYEVFSDFKKPKKKREWKSEAAPNKELAEGIANAITKFQDSTPSEKIIDVDDASEEDDPFRLT